MNNESYSRTSDDLTRRDFLKAGSVAAITSVAVARAFAGEPGPPVPSDLKLWYRQPAANWNEALPIGSGRLAAMVFGAVAAERIQLNEDTVWAGEKRDRSNPQGGRNLAEVRRLLFAGKPKEAEELAEKTIIAVPKRMPPYQPLGDLLLRFKDQDKASDYIRELDIDSGFVRVAYSCGGARFTRELFSSAVDQVIVVRLTC